MESKYSSVNRERRTEKSYTLPALLLEAATTARWWSEESSSDPAELADLIESFYHGEEKEMKVEEEVEDDDEDAGHSALATLLDESEDDPVARRLRAEADRAVGTIGLVHRGHGLKMRVVDWLREQGFDAGLCKSSWERFDDGVPAGHHHYIDVMSGGGGYSTQRYILDLDFAAEFEIPRPSAAYSALLRCVPRTFSGTAGTLERIVSVMCAAIRESMRSAGMPLPPWRRKQYVESKWLGGYERHTAEPPPWKSVERAEGWRKKVAWRVELDGREAERRRRMATA